MMYVYILTNKARGTLYIGVSNNLRRRLYEHRHGLTLNFTSAYRLHRLVYFETFESPELAIRREKQLKGGSRKKKIELIELSNPSWKDLSLQWE